MRHHPWQIAMKGTLPIILIAAVIQGWALYGLHQSIKHSFWPATNSGWLLALYSLVIFIPLAIQLLSEHARSKVIWALLSVIAIAYFYFGWHYGTAISTDPAGKLMDSENLSLAIFTMTVLGLLILPFLQLRLLTGAWQPRYPLLFTSAWRNKVMLAEAGLFTGLFWLLLLLWQELFNMLGIGYFRELFQEPLFIYPITTLVFGIALHLIGSVERLTSAILEQLLNVLKWLAIVAGFILTLFTIALMFKLPDLAFSGQKAIGAAWLLWLVAVMVLLINAAYRDGSLEQPYPTWIAFSLRCVTPLTIIISSTAMYALYVRAQRYGLTVERIWAFIVAATALTYSIGYSVAALRKGPWLQGIGRVNVIAAIALIATIALTLTPLLSPYRLAANSQYRMSLAKTTALETDRIALSSFRYLRFEAGRYGMQRLRELSELKDHPDAQRIQTAALAALQSTHKWQATPVDTVAMIDAVKLYPSGRLLDTKLRAKLLEDSNKTRNHTDAPAVGIFIDLTDDNADEFVLLHNFAGNVYQQVEGEWILKGNALGENPHTGDASAILKDLDAGKVSVAIPEWKELVIGNRRFRISAP